MGKVKCRLRNVRSPQAAADAAILEDPNAQVTGLAPVISPRCCDPSQRIAVLVAVDVALADMVGRADEAIRLHPLDPF